MPKFKPQYSRLLFIDRKIREGTYPNCPSLAREWEVSGRTVQRDIDYFRDELGAPVDFDRKHNGYFYTEEHYRLPTVPICESDLFAVCLAAKALKQFENTPLHAKLSSVFDKIQQSLPHALQVNPSWISERILMFPEPSTLIVPEVWDVFAAAISQNRSIRFSHKSPGDSRHSTRCVDPYYLVNYRGEWYVTSMCHKRKAIRTFGLSRIRSAKLLPDTFSMPEGYDVDTMFGDRFGIIWKESRFAVRIRFSRKLAHYIREREWHPLQKITREKGGSIVLEFTTNHINEVKDWVLSWGSGAKVLSPPELVDKMREEIAAAAGNYGLSTEKELKNG